MNKIRNVSLSFISVALIFLATSLSLKAVDCAAKYKQCLGSCGRIASCVFVCNNAKSICECKDCPDEYVVVTSGWNLFNVHKKRITGVEKMGAMVVQENDFPITAAEPNTCPNLESDPRCTKDDKFRVVIQNKGCYVIWPSERGARATPLLCGKKISKGSAQRSAQQPKNKR